MNDKRIPLWVLVKASDMAMDTLEFYRLGDIEPSNEEWAEIEQEHLDDLVRYHNIR